MSTSSAQLYFELSNKDSYNYVHWPSWEHDKKSTCKFYFDINDTFEEEDCSSVEEDELTFEKKSKQNTHTSLLSQMLSQEKSTSQSSSSLKRCQSKYQHLNEWFSSSS